MEVSRKLQADLILRLQAIPGLLHVPCPERSDGFSTFMFCGKEIAHFHGFTEIDVRLGKDFIRAERLVHPEIALMHAGRAKSSHWIVLQYSSLEDVERIIGIMTRFCAQGT